MLLPICRPSKLGQERQTPLCVSLRVARILLAIIVCPWAFVGCQPSNETETAGNVQAPGEVAQATTNQGTSETGSGDRSEGIFERRILPIFHSPNPSSCSECHLSGVDLRDYIRPTQQETFSSLVAAGLINAQSPDESKLLQFIQRAPARSSLDTEQLRQTEYEAFREWIHAAVETPELLARQDAARPIGPSVPIEVVRHAREDRVLASFIDNIWTEIGRCAACHSPDRNAEQVQEHGDLVSWIVLNDPQATLDYMVANGLIDTDEPTSSPLLTKPTMQVDHGGGQKMVVGDRSYKQFRAFLDDYAAVVNGGYQTSEQLPRRDGEQSFVTDIWLKIEGVPSEFDQRLLQVDLFAAEGDGWSETRVATSDRPVFGAGQLWQQTLSLVAPRGSARAERLAEQVLPPGRYLVRIHVDREQKLATDFRAEMGQEDFVGEVEVQSNWPAGYGAMTVIQYPAAR